MTFKTLFVSSVLLATSVARAEVAEFVSFSGGGDVAGFLAGEALKSGAAQYSKFALVFEQPKELKRIEFKSCDGELKDGIDVFLDPGYRRVFVEGGVKKFKIDVPGEPVRSIAIVFGRNHDFCIDGFKLVPKKGSALEVKSTRSVEAKFKPEGWGTELFDSKPQTAQAGWKEATIEFGEPRGIDRIEVWQAAAGDKATSISFAFDANPPITFETANSTGKQEFKLEAAVTAKKVVVKSKNGGLGEMKFVSGQEEFVPAALFASSDEMALRKIASTSFASMLDRELVAKMDDKETWTFRFRSDGTFFIRGYQYDISEASAFSALGSYTIDKSTKTGAKLKLSGLRVPTGLAWDGVLCPFECGGAIDPKATLVTDLVELEEAKAGAVMIRNRVAASKRALPFSDLKSRNSAFED